MLTGSCRCCSFISFQEIRFLAAKGLAEGQNRGFLLRLQTLGLAEGSNLDRAEESRLFLDTLRTH